MHLIKLGGEILWNLSLNGGVSGSLRTILCLVALVWPVSFFSNEKMSWCSFQFLKKQLLPLSFCESGLFLRLLDQENMGHLGDGIGSDHPGYGHAFLNFEPILGIVSQDYWGCHWLGWHKQSAHLSPEGEKVTSFPTHESSCSIYTHVGPG